MMKRKETNQRPRLRCPNCRSYRIMGTREHFKCRNCGFTHDMTSTVPKKPKSIGEEMNERLQISSR